MQLTTRRRYAVTAMLDVALHQDIEDGKTVSLADISKRQGISQSYLEQLFAKLRRKKLINSNRGPGGGYLIAKSLNTLTVAQVIEAIEEKKLEQTHCGGVCQCIQGFPCLTWKLWDDLGKMTYHFLNSVTFQDLVAQSTHHMLTYRHKKCRPEK